MVGDTDNVLQPIPQLASTDVASTEAESTDDGSSQHSDPGHLEAVQVPKESRSVAIDRKRVEQTGSSEESMVRGGDDRSHDNRVDKATRNGTAGLLEDNGERASSGVTIGEAWVVVWHIQTDDQDGKKVEKQDTPEDVTHDLGQVLGWVFRLTGGDGDGLGAATEGC